MCSFFTLMFLSLLFYCIQLMLFDYAALVVEKV